MDDANSNGTRWVNSLGLAKNRSSNATLTHYSSVLLFYTPWKHQKIFRFSNVFRGYRKPTPGCNGLMQMICFWQAMETCMDSDPATYIATIFLYFYGSKWYFLKRWKSKKQENIQKQPSRNVLKKRCSASMQQIHRRTPKPKCDFNKVQHRNISQFSEAPIKRCS